ncbi:MAG: hypothetical protein ABIN89_29220 [Chitinophagaceae bacterium]
MAAAIGNEAANNNTGQRNLLCRLVFAFIFFFLLYYQFSNTLVHQLQSPVLKFPYVDITYWIFHLLKIPELITRNYLISCCFDNLLFVSCLLSFFFPNRRGFIILFFLLYFIYFIIFNTYGTHHTHSKIGILLMPVPFMFRRPITFKYMWEAMRYFALFFYADAFLWKLFRFTFLHADQGILILKRNFAAYLYYNSQTFLGGAYTWLLHNPYLIELIFYTGFIAEGFFLVGFFTRRYDRYLILISILMPVGFLFLSDAFFFEMLVLSFTFIRLRELPASAIGTV